METRVVQIRGRGNLTLPAKWRERYSLNEGDPVTLIDLDGVMIVSPKLSLVDKLGAEIETVRNEAGLSVDDLLADLPSQRSSYKRG